MAPGIGEGKGQTLEELADYIRLSMPQAKFISKLEINEKWGAVSFHWQGRDFLVRTSREVFELRGKRLYATGASMLIHCTLTKRTRHERAIEAIVEALRQAEDMLGSRFRHDTGLKVLASVKSTLASLAGVASEANKRPQGRTEIRPRPSLSVAA